MRRALPAALALALAACANAGQDAVLAVSATGTVTGHVYFDADGSQSANGADSGIGGVRVLLVRAGDTLHAVSTTLSLAGGAFSFPAVPVGVYAVRLDTTTIGAGLGVLDIDSTSFTVLPEGTVDINAGVGFPSVSIAAALALPAGRTVFLTGIALNDFLEFADSVVHLADGAKAIRLTRLRNPIAAGDSARVRGVTARRDGLPVLDDVRVFPLGQGLLPAAIALTAARAAAADSQRLDAHLVIVRGVTIQDTATVADGFRLTVDDTSGTLEVLLDLLADPAFTAANLPGVYLPGARFDIVGVLQPSAAATWRLKPRAATDLRRL